MTLPGISTTVNIRLGIMERKDYGHCRFSDIHGNYIAFQNCLQYALEKNINFFIFLGDYLGEFPYPQKTMNMLYSMNHRYKCFYIRGNKEDYWINYPNKG